VKYLKIILITLFGTWFFQESNAQVFVKGKPLFFSESKRAIPLINLPKIDSKKLSKEKKRDSKHKVLKYAENIFCNIDLKKDGLLTINSNGDKAWYLLIKSENAFSLGLLFKNYRLPPRAKLFVYSSDRKHIRGAFTYLNNKPNSFLAISPIKGDELILEYQEPQDAEFEGELQILSVSHDYKNVFEYLGNKSSLFGKSGECNVNINCEKDELWQKLKYSVCKIVYNGSLCSGALINNTNVDGKAYLLTANHCIDNEFDANSAIFYFNYESPTCENQDGIEDQSISSSSLVSSPPFKTLDFTLLELSIDPLPEYKPYFAGWTREIENPTLVTSIHHPLGDVKKISQSLDGALISNYGDGYNEFTHWWIDTWDVGTTEDGSSGSPLFNKEGLIIGDLSGGDASCDFNFNDYYQQFSSSWNYFSDSTYQLKCWLDPKNSGIISLEGYQPYDTIPSQLRASVSDTLINLYWNVPSDTVNVDKYYVYRDAVKLDSTPYPNYTDTLAYRNTVYSYWVTAKYHSPTIYESDSSNVISIKTMNPISIPFDEDFETGNTLPTDWHLEKNDITEEWIFKEGGYIGILDTAFEGSVNSYFYGTSGESSKLILPRFDFSTNTHVLLSFYIQMKGILGTSHELNVLYKEIDSLQWKRIQSFKSEIENWEKKNMILPNLSSNYQIAFEGKGIQGYGIAIDSIKIMEDLNFIDPDIIIDKDTICISDSVEFSTSINNSHSLLWQFGPAAIPSSRVGEGPHKVKYLSQGFKYAKLIVDNTYIKDSLAIVAVIDVPKPTFTQNGNMLTSNLNYGNQWFLNGEEIIDAVNQKHIIEEDGNYHVEVTNPLNCSNVSQSIFVLVNGLEESYIGDNANEIIIIYPNPNNGNFIIELTKVENGTEYNFELVDITGRVRNSGIILSFEKSKEVTNSGLPNGIYFVRIYSNDKYFTKKIIIRN
jgi:hypothetical protein